MDIIAVVGARPNFMKIGPLLAPLRGAGIHVRIVHTGQHYDTAMSAVFFDELGLPEPDWHLSVGSGTHAAQTGAAMVGLEDLFAAQRPGAVMVVGDVNSTLAAALAAVKLGVPVVHLEAGLRSFDMRMPEEVNRVVTDRLSAMLLAPSRTATSNLGAEGIDSSRVFDVGNVMAESVLRFAPDASERRPAAHLGLEPGGYVLATVHRAENTSDPLRLEGIVDGLGSSPLPVLLPAHPRTRPMLERYETAAAAKGVRVIDPVGYIDMLALQRDAAAIVTDSGGVQEEACVLGTPCVTVRDATEHVETLWVGANRLVEASPGAIAQGLQGALASTRGWELPEGWDTDVSSRVARVLSEGVTPL